ncbi:3-hydroxyacyl-CoA dehydrogenase NAD-binding domain-containing protein [Flavobacteriaceae bacterium]|nr:3-hydroxyacyl-CoA dehydrogenase NAD-binding domain-containing protein [Flavobacteriaceae bacterium]MDC1060681.1 3-hydroxyacyl-CoA dehydrogenase NAD-binding domain-containing protein [Flavobacteriaceae bacterium]
METIQNKLLSFSVDSEGIGTLVINQTEESTNLFSEAFITQYIDVAQQAIADDTVKGVIVTSGKPIFMAGADLRALLEDIPDKKAFTERILHLHAGLRSIETGGKPFVAAINGTALGGGLELCLACHHRIAIDSTKIKIGFPEIKVGLFPGGGGTVKAPYLLGIQTALMYLLQGIEARPQKALKDGLIDAVAETEAEMLAAAKAFILAKPNPVQPWDNKRHKIPGGGIWTPNGIQTLAGASGNVGKLTHGNYPSAQKIVKVIHDGLQIPIDRALEVEARSFTHAACSKEAKNMIRTGFFAIQDAAKGKARPKDQPKYEVNKLGVLGAGMMGAGIAYVSAKAGMNVVLKDVSVEGAEKGKAYSANLLDKAIAKKYSTPKKKEALLAKITPTDDPNAVEGSDLIIEAVFENVDLKDRVTKETEAVLGEDKIYGSNTSTIPISLLAQSSKRPENFIGIHFFSPVDKMPLVEIIVGEKTEDKAIAAAVDYTVAIKKVPIVVNDSRGFFTSRCFGTFVSEGMFLLEEGVPAPMLERIATKIGMPVGPLAVHDEVSLTLSVHIFESDPAEKQESEKRTYAIVKNLVENHKRTGKRDGAGFYDYPKGGQKKLWPGLKEIFTPNVAAVSEEIISKRLLSRQVLESYRCLDEGVLRSTTDGDIGSILGWGFPIFTGGALSYIDYVGMDNFIADCDAFKAAYGAHWEVPQSLRDLAAAGKSIHDFGK